MVLADLAGFAWVLTGVRGRVVRPRATKRTLGATGKGVRRFVG